MSFLKNISAEFIKLKYAPIIWLICLVVIAVTAIIFAATILDSSNVIQLGKNPWDRQLGVALGIFGVFLAIPFLVMLISTSVFTENQAKGWNYMYSAPKTRTSFFYSKLLSILLTILMLIGLVISSTILSAYLLDFMMPELEFRHYEKNLGRHFIKFTHIFISMLGAIGIQFFLSLRFKGFLIPMSFGIVAFIVGFIVGTLNKPIALYFPYCYPSIVKDHNMFTIDKIGIVEGPWVNTVEIHSIIIFVIFIALANVLEVRKGVS